MAGSSEPPGGRQSCLRLSSWPDAPQSCLAWPVQRPLALETSPFAVRSLLRRGAHAFPGRMYSQKFLSPFPAHCGPLATPEQHGTRAASPVLCLTPPHPVWVAPRGGRHPERVTFPSLPRFGLPAKNPGETQHCPGGRGRPTSSVPLGRWGVRLLGLTRRTSPCGELNTWPPRLPQFWGPEARHQGPRSL